MPGSLARKERRRKEREGNLVSSTPKAAYAESVDEEEPQGGAVQAAEEMQPYHTIGRERPEEPQPQPSPRQATHPLLASDGQDALVRGRVYQKQSKSRSKRGPPPRIPRESGPPFGSLYNHAPSVYEEALRQLRNMTPEDSARLKQAVMSQMAAAGFSLPVGSRPDGAQGVSIPLSSITLPSWARSTRDENIVTKEEAKNLRHTLFEKLDEASEQVPCPLPLGTAVKELKAAASPVFQTVGNVDGASQSAEIISPEKEALVGEQTSVEQHRDGDEQSNIDTKSQAQSGSDAPLASPVPIPYGPISEGHVPADAGDRKETAPSLARRVVVEASRDPLRDTPPKNTFSMTESIAHPDDIARINNLSKKFRQSLENARIEIHPVQGVTLHHGMTHPSSSSDYASSSGDSGGKSNTSRTRCITNDGILELKASPFKVNPAKLPAKEHRRKVSLKLPVNVSRSHLAYSRRTVYRAHSASLSTDEGGLSSYEAEERELEYKHRHIFIGIASLDDFLEILEVTPTHATSRRHVVKAFGILACAEQVQARQCSISPDGWNFVTRTTHDDILTRTDYLTESHVKLGSITLGKFLAKIPFDEKAEIAAIKVVEAFCLASHLDAEATYGSQSKAKAFRSWVVKENAERKNP